MSHHDIPATPEMNMWGGFDAAMPPILEVASGDTVTLTSWMAGYEAQLHPDPARVHPLHLRAINEVRPGPGPHFATGPVYVQGATRGDVLQIDILEHDFPCDWGYTCILPLQGTIPEDFDVYEVMHPDIDRTRGVMVLPWGKEIPLDPFFGVLAVAPPAHWGLCPSPPPRKFGGNMDNKELKPGTTLYLPVFNEGALFIAGDGHGVQGDGEVCISALETALTGTFRLTVRKDLDYAHPFAESPTHLISIGLDEDLDDAAKQAVREMVEHVRRRTTLARSEAYMLCSLAGDLRVTQTVDGVKGCHMMLPKSAL